MGRANEIIADLESGGVTSYHVLTSFFYKGGHPDDHTDELAELKKKYTAIDTLIAKMKHRDELAPVPRVSRQIGLVSKPFQEEKCRRYRGL